MQGQTPTCQDPETWPRARRPARYFWERGGGGARTCDWRPLLPAAVFRLSGILRSFWPVLVLLGLCTTSLWGAPPALPPPLLSFYSFSLIADSPYSPHYFSRPPPHPVTVIRSGVIFPTLFGGGGPTEDM